MTVKALICTRQKEEDNKSPLPDGSLKSSLESPENAIDIDIFFPVAKWRRLISIGGTPVCSKAQASKSIKKAKEERACVIVELSHLQDNSQKSAAGGKVSRKKSNSQSAGSSSSSGGGASSSASSSSAIATPSMPLTPAVASSTASAPAPPEAPAATSVASSSSETTASPATLAEAGVTLSLTGSSKSDASSHKVVKSSDIATSAGQQSISKADDNNSDRNFAETFEHYAKYWDYGAFLGKEIKTIKTSIAHFVENHKSKFAKFARHTNSAAGPTLWKKIMKGGASSQNAARERVVSDWANKIQSGEFKHSSAVTPSPLSEETLAEVEVPTPSNITTAAASTTPAAQIVASPQNAPRVVAVDPWVIPKKNKLGSARAGGKKKGFNPPPPFIHSIAALNIVNLVC